MAKLSTLSLEELYAKPKRSKAAEIAIISKSDFSKVNTQYCEGICKLKCKSYSNVILESTPVDILIIQDHKNPPGKYDRRKDQQDSIQAGVIDFISKQAGLAGLRYRVTSLLKCTAEEKDFPSGKPPTQTTLQKCFPYLHTELINTKPKVIISLGTATTKALGLSKHSNTGNRGEIAISVYGPVVMTLHPRILTYIRQNARGAAGMWGPDYLKVIQRDFEKAGKIARGQWKYDPNTRSQVVENLAKTRIKITRTLDDVQGIYDEINQLPETAVVSFDTETTSLDPLDPALKILTVQFGWRSQSTGEIVSGVVPLFHRANTMYDAKLAWDIVSPILTSNRKKVGHNAKFDILVLYWAMNIRVNNACFDTLLLLHSIESGTQGCYGLKRACWDHLYEKGYAGYEDELGDLKKLAKSKAEEETIEEESYEENCSII